MTSRGEKSGPISELARKAQEITQNMLNHSAINGKALVVEDSATRILIEIVTAEAGLVIGSQGETLNAMQTLVRAITSVDNEKRIPIMLDCQGYRGRREAALINQAHELAAQVRESGKEAVIEGLSPYERRIVHLALADDPTIVTYSEGEGEDRRLVVSPAD